MEHQQEFSATVRNVNLVQSLIASAKKEGKKYLDVGHYFRHTIDVLEAEGYECEERGEGYEKHLRVSWK